MVKNLRRSLYVFFVLLVMIYYGCTRNDESLIPSYISIDAFTLESNPNIQHSEGSLSHNITDVWVYLDSELLGAYEMPVTLPVLAEGVHAIRIKPGIKINGISETRGEYLFYESYDIELNLVKDSVHVLNPVTRYKDFTEFKWFESFEDSHSSLVKSSRSDTTVRTTDDINRVFEGDYSGIVNTTSDRFFFECLTNESYQLPATGEDVYLELNFKTTTNVTVGIFANYLSQSFQVPVVVLNPTDEWKKIYINLRNAVSTYNQATDYNIFLGATQGDGEPDAEILIDNLKLVH